jgi:hypothetical protein
MKFSEIWDQLRAKQPRIDDADARVTFRADKLKQLLIQVYDQGHAEGVESSRNVENLFAKMWGGK